MECPVCKNEFDEYTGRKPKKFCSDACKVKFWNAQKKVVENNKPEKKKEIENDRNPTEKKKSDHENPLTFEEMMAAAESLVTSKNK